MPHHQDQAGTAGPAGPAHDGASRHPAAGPRQPTDHRTDGSHAMHLVMIGGSDAGISAALRARELDPGAEVTVVVADAYPNFSICGIPYYLSGEVTPLAQPGSPHHCRPGSDRDEACGWTPPPAGSTSPGRKLLVTAADGSEELLSYDKLDRRHRRGPGPAPDRRPGRAGRSAPDDGVHLLHSMGDTFAVMRTLEKRHPASAVIVGAGYIGLEMADALTVRGLAGHPDGAAARGATHRRPRTRRPGPRPARSARRRGPDRHHRPADQPRPRRPGGRLRGPGHRGRRHGR